MIERLLILWHFIATRWLPTPCDHEERLRRFLAAAPRFSDVMTKSLFLEHFAELNRHGITLEQATEVALRAEREKKKGKAQRVASGRRIDQRNAGHE